MWAVVVSDHKNTDYYLEVASKDKYQTANSMRIQFEQRFEMELEKIAQSLVRSFNDTNTTFVLNAAVNLRLLCLLITVI